MDKETKQKIMKWSVMAFTIANFLLVLGFVIYLYFWVKGRM